MNDFSMSKSKNSNVSVSIRFPEELHEEIKNIVHNANKGKKTKLYSLNGFVISACEYAIKNMKKD